MWNLHSFELLSKLLHFLDITHLYQTTPLMGLLLSSTTKMSDHRLFRFQKPEWLNSPNTRTAGVYLAGALVRTFSA